MSANAMPPARQLGSAIEPVTAHVYFSPECHANYHALGFAQSSGEFNGVAAPDGPAYFTSRGSVMGQVAPELVAAAFAVFSPAAVVPAVTFGWSITDATTICTARDDGAMGQMRRLLGERPAGVDRANSILRRAVSVLRPEGRPLYAGLLSLGIPDDPLFAVWRAGDMLREFRGDGHIAALVCEGLSGLEALITHAGAGDVTAKVLASSRAWPEQEWNEGVDGLASRGIVNADGSLTEKGRAQRDRIELRTDELSIAPYSVLGDEKCERVRELARPLSKAIVDSGMIGFR